MFIIIQILEFNKIIIKEKKLNYFPEKYECEIIGCNNLVINDKGEGCFSVVV